MCVIIGRTYIQRKSFRIGFNRMASIHILIQAESGQMWAISEAIEKIDHVEAVHVVTGPYDLIAYLEMPVEDLRAVMDSIHRIQGILRTETCIAVRS